MGNAPKVFFFSSKGNTLIGSITIFLKHWALPSIIEPWRCFPLAHLYSLYTWKFFGQRQNIWDKNAVQVGTSWECHWELGEQFENTMRTHGKRNKSFTLLHTPPPQPKIIWNWPSWVHVEPSHWPHENYGLEIDCHHFFCMG